MTSKYAHLEKDTLIRLLERNDAEQPPGLVWERPTDAGGELDPETVRNRDFVALDLDESLSHGDAPWHNLIIEGDNPSNASNLKRID